MIMYEYSANWKQLMCLRTLLSEQEVARDWMPVRVLKQRTDEHT